MAVTIYTKQSCGFCHRAKRLLHSKGVDFIEISVDSDLERRSEMIRRSGRYTVPQIWIGEQHVGGCDDLYALDWRGELDPLLAAETSGASRD